MNILFLNYEFPPLGGGAANATLALAREFAALKHRTVVLTSRFQDQPIREKKDGFVIWRLPVWRRHMDKCSPPEMLTYIASGVLHAGKVCGKFRPDITLCFFGIPGGPIAWWMKKRFGVPYVVGLRGGDVPGFMGRDLAMYHNLTRPFIRRIWQDSNGVVANSEGLADLARESLPKYPFDVIPNGVDIETFSPQKSDITSTKSKNNEKPVRLLFVGRLSTQKGLDGLMKALGKMQRDNPDLPDWHLKIVGDGPERDKLQRLADQNKIAQNIDWEGWVLKPEMPKVYGGADLFVFPSLDEGMPNAVLEAMACGLPVIGTRISGTEELVVDDQTGTLLEPGDVNALSDALANSIQDRDWRIRCAKQSRERAETYSWRSTAQKFLDVLEKAKAKGKK